MAGFFSLAERPSPFLMLRSFGDHFSDSSSSFGLLLSFIFPPLPPCWIPTERGTSRRREKGLKSTWALAKKSLTSLPSRECDRGRVLVWIQRTLLSRNAQVRSKIQHGKLSQEKNDFARTLPELVKCQATRLLNRVRDGKFLFSTRLFAFSRQ